MRASVKTIGPASATTASATIATRTSISATSDGSRMRTAAVRDGWHEPQARKRHALRVMRAQQVNQHRQRGQRQRPERGGVQPADHRRGSLPPLPQEVAAQRRIERLVGQDARVVDAVARAARMPPFEELGERMPVARARGRARQQPASRLQIFELDFRPERKLQLVARQHVEHRHLVPHAHGAPQLRFDRLLVVVEIGDEDQQRRGG